MKIRYYHSSVWVNILSACAAFELAAAPAVSSWEQLQADLKANAPGVWSYNGFLKSSLFASLAVTTNKAVFLEMSCQRDYPLVALAGFFCLTNSFPGDGLECAMNVMLEAKEGAAAVYYPLFDYLQQKHDLPAFKRAFSAVSSRRPRDLRNYFVLLTTLPVDAVYAWFHDQFRPPVPLVCEAVVLDKLYGEPDERTRPVTSAMSVTLARLESVPGFPRSVYVMYAPDNVGKSALLADLTCVLCDETLTDPEILPVILKRAGYVRELPLDTLQLSGKRHELIKRVLERTTKR